MVFDCFGNSIDNPWVKGVRHNKVFVQFFIRNKAGKGFGSSQLHRFGNLAGMTLQSAPENARKSGDVIDLVREVRAGLQKPHCSAP